MKHLKNLFGVGMGTILLFSPMLVVAEPLPGSTNVQFPLPGTTNVSPGSGSFSVQNPLGDVRDFNTLLKKLLDAAIIIGIPIAVLFIVYAGFKFVFARGNEKSLAEAKQNFFWTIVGIVIFLGAWLIARVLAETIRQLGAPLQ